MGIADDAAHGQVVLFGGYSNSFLGDTWIWDGTVWTQRTPAHAPSARSSMSMAYDAAHGQVVLFGGYDNGHLGDTWTWDGTDWTQRTPAHAPSARYAMGMAYDASHGQVVLFGGYDGRFRRDTWNWDGADWTQRTPALAPLLRSAMGMADDAVRGQVVLFGGFHNGSPLGDIWTWDGTDWAVPLRASIKLTPSSGPPGTAVHVHGRGYSAFEKVVLIFVDSIAGTARLATVAADGTGSFRVQVTIPDTATIGTQKVVAGAAATRQNATRGFAVT